MGGLIKFLGRFRSASNSMLALRASHLISVSELAALHVIYMYRGTGTVMSQYLYTRVHGQVLYDQLLSER